jgi:hypothetical protein
MGSVVNIRDSNDLLCYVSLNSTAGQQAVPLGSFKVWHLSWLAAAVFHWLPIPYTSYIIECMRDCMTYVIACCRLQTRPVYINTAELPELAPLNEAQPLSQFCRYRTGDDPDALPRTYTISQVVTPLTEVTLPDGSVGYEEAPPPPFDPFRLEDEDQESPLCPRPPEGVGHPYMVAWSQHWYDTVPDGEYKVRTAV